MLLLAKQRTSTHHTLAIASSMCYSRTMTQPSISTHEAIAKRRTFAIISHPDAGKTSVTEQLLLYGGAINTAGSIKAKKSAKHATSDWMKLEQERGISVQTAVMQFIYQDHIINLIDTPGHADFSEDTYRSLSAADAAVMIIDAAKGMEQRSRKLAEICTQRHMPIITFINKIDRQGKDPLDLIDDIEATLGVTCHPLTWPIGMGKAHAGIYRCSDQSIVAYHRHQQRGKIPEHQLVDPKSLSTPEHIDAWQEAKACIDLLQEPINNFDQTAFLKGQQTPLLFGSALHQIGLDNLLDALISHAPAPGKASADPRDVMPCEKHFSGFVFKIQANMDPKHRDRMAFMKICSGVYQPGIDVLHVRSRKKRQLKNAMTFMAGKRNTIDEALPGDIIGIHNRGGIQIGDTFTQGEQLTFIGIPSFAPELFKRIIITDPLKKKALVKGLKELSEEGAAQIFYPIGSNDLIVGAVGVLQFDVLTHRLLHEYQVQCQYSAVNIACARWIEGDENMIASLKAQSQHVAIDAMGHTCYLAPSRVHLTLIQEKWPKIHFYQSRET